MRRKGDTKMTDFFSRTEKACKRKFMEIGGGEEIIEIEMVKKRKMEQEKARMGEKMRKNEISNENDEKSSTLQLQTVREREIRVEHKIIQMKQENEEIWGPLQ